MFHGPGIVRGLEVSADTSGVVSVTPGFAVDPYGREIEVCDPTELSIPDAAAPISIFVLHAEVETDRGTTPSGGPPGVEPVTFDDLGSQGVRLITA